MVDPAGHVQVPFLLRMKVLSLQIVQELSEELEHDLQEGWQEMQEPSES